MKQVVFLMIFCSLILGEKVFAGKGTGKVLDISVRRDLNILLVRVENYSNHPENGCVTWFHTFAAPYNEPVSKALYAMFLTAMTAEKKVVITGTNQCLLNTGSEEIREANIGPWQN